MAITIASAPTAWRRAATLIVAASDSKDKTNVDYTCAGTNDDVTIESAFAALPAAGGRVLLLEGNYTLGSSIDILKSDVTLEGQGAGTIIKGAIAVSYIIVGNGATALNGIEIANLKIDGTDQTAGYGIYVYGASAYLISNTIITNCRISDTGGILNTLGINTLIEKNIIEAKGTGISVQGAAAVHTNKCIIIGNQIYSSTGHGISCGYADRTAITGNQIYSPGASGISANASNFNNITGNQIYGPVTYGIYLESCAGGMITGNLICSPGASGIYIYKCTYSITTGNQIYDPVTDGIYNRSYSADVNSKYCIMTGNQIYSPGNNGISNSSNSDHCTITVNQIDAVPDGYCGILDLADYTVISSNRISNSAGRELRINGLNSICIGNLTG